MNGDKRYRRSSELINWSTLKNREIEMDEKINGDIYEGKKEGMERRRVFRECGH